MDKTIVIIDGNSLVNRAYFAMQRPMVTKDGLYTQGVFGFLRMLEKIEKDYEPGYIVVAFDLKAPTFRHKEYEDYKAGRKKMPDELAMQMPILKEVLAARNIKMLEMEGFEADDIIGTIAARAEDEGLEPLIITGDKDELQLATDKTKVLITRKGISEFDLYDRQAMIDEYGFTPDQFIDFKGLMGDPSDNIPGLPGVGKKTAQKLILEYGSVEGLLENIDNMKKSKLKEKIEENAQLAVMSKRLATIVKNVPIEIDFSEFKFEEPDYAKLIEIYRKLEFNSFLKNLKKENLADLSTGDDGEADNNTKVISADDVVKKNLNPAGSQDDKDEFYRLIKECDHLAVKILNNRDHKKIPEIIGAGILAIKNEDDFKFVYLDRPDDECMAELVRVFNEIEPEISGCGLIDDYYALMAYGMEHFNTGFDAAIAEYVLDSGRSSYEINELAASYLNEGITDEKTFFKDNSQMDLMGDQAEKYAEYCLDWCRISVALRRVLEDKLKKDGSDRVYYEIENPLIEIMAYMGSVGFRVNADELAVTGESIKIQIDSISSKIYELAGEEFNINSPIQLGEVLFEKLGLPAGKKTKRGYSTSAGVLEKLEDKHDIVPLILEYRMLSKLNSTYIEGLIPLVGEDGRIHAHFQQTVAATGRISCTEPNLQNIPVRNELGRGIRKAFVPSEGCFLTGADYSQIELRVLADMADDDALIKAFNEGQDIHRHTAATVLGVPEDEITILQRSQAKAINFGVIYGMSSFRLSSDLHISMKEAEKYINDYFRKYPQVKLFMDAQIADAKSKGYVKTVMGRKRYIKEISSSNYMARQLGERLAKNSPIQGSAADIIKLAMIKVYDELKKRGLKSRLILQIHDELIIETASDEENEVKTLLKECMENVMQMKVDLDVDINSGNTWYELK